MKTRMFILTLMAALSASAQLPSDFRSEQIYLNPQYHAYLPGDTIQLEGMVTCLAADQNVPFSNYLYIECFDERDSLLCRQKVNCKQEGYFNTRIPTDFLWPAGVYYLRAYTQLMRNFSPESFAQQAFLLGKEFPRREERVYGANCRMVPAGGKLVAGHLQTVVALLTDECSFPVRADLLLMDERGDTISPVRTSASGMTAMNFIPRAGATYHLQGNVDGEFYRFPLPPVETGLKVQGTLNGTRLNYQILNAGEDLSRYRLYTFDRQNGLTQVPSLRTQGIVLLHHSPSVLSVFLADSALNIFSEATVAARYRMEEKLQAPDTLSIGDSLRYRLPSLPSGSRVMVRVAADNDLLTSHAETELNYRSDFTSPLPFPSRLYTGHAAERNRDLHAWLSTASFHRFSLKDAATKGTSIYEFLPEEVMAFTGWIEKKSLHPMSNGQLVAYHTVNDFVYDVDLDAEGRFRIAVDDFVEGEEFFLQAITPKGKPDFANYHVDDESFPALLNNRRFVLPVSRYANTEVTVGNTFDLSYTVGKDKLRNYTLPNVTVKARLKTEEAVPTNKFYSTNYTDREEIEAHAYGTLYDILRAMPGITISYTVESSTSSGSGGNSAIIEQAWGSNRPSKEGVVGEKKVWNIVSNRGASLLKGESNNLPILMDNARFTKDDYDFVLYTPADEIESVELLRPWQALQYTFGAINGAILVKTRRYKEREPLPSKGAMYSPTGLSKLDGTYREQPWTADRPGSFRLMIDVFSPSGIRSYEHRFEVQE